MRLVFLELSLVAAIVVTLSVGCVKRTHELKAAPAVQSLESHTAPLEVEKSKGSLGSKPRK